MELMKGREVEGEVVGACVRMQRKGGSERVCANACVFSTASTMIS